jgi:hypothetical protein
MAHCHFLGCVNSLFGTAHNRFSFDPRAQADVSASSSPFDAGAPEQFQQSVIHAAAAPAISFAEMRAAFAAAIKGSPLDQRWSFAV